MKTKEFIKRVKEMGYDVDNTTALLRINKQGDRCANIEKNYDEMLLFNTANIPFAKLCIEYAETPIAEREEMKKYTVVIPDPLRRGRRVMALGRLEEYKDEIIIQHLKPETLKSERCILTEAEIKRNHAYLWQFAKEVTK